MSDELRDFCNRLHEQLREKDAEIERLKAERRSLWLKIVTRIAENKRLLQELDEAEARAFALEQKEAAREKRFRMERFN